MNLTPYGILLLCLCACSSGAPTIYGQGVPGPATRPAFAPPGSTPAGRGAPVVGQPGFSGAPRPRGTDERVLPPTREPGIWASDSEPRASGTYSQDREVVVFDFLPALPLAADESEKEKARTCTQLIRSATDYTPYLAGGVFRISVELRHCMLARLYLECVTRAKDWAREKDKDEGTQLMWRNLWVAAVDDVKRQCTMPRVPGSQAQLMEESILKQMSGYMFREAMERQN